MSAAAWGSDDSWDIFSLNELAEGDLDSYLQKVADRAASKFDASGASIFLSDDDSGLYRVRARAGSHSTVPDSAVIVRSQGIAGRVVTAGTARILGDIGSEPDLIDIGPKERSSVASSLIVPLIEPSGEVIGVLNLSRHEAANKFESDDLELAKAVASMVALAVSNARLMHKLRRQMYEVQNTSEKLQAVFDSVSTAMLVLDPVGNVAEFNASARALVSRKGKGWVRSESVTPAIQGAIESLRESGASQSVRVLDPGSGKSWLLHGTPLTSGGLVLTMLDLTDHEAALRESERLIRLAEIGQMTAAVAHEIRNPLTGIRSAAQVVRDDPSVAAEFLAVIDEEVVKLSNLCDEFLAFARPLELELLPCDLGAIVADVCERQRPEFDADGVELTLQVATGMPTINLDARRVGQVVINLLRNARQACSRGSKVQVRVESGWFSVADYGHGMAPDLLERLFSPFFTTKPDGTGLGLSNVRRILDGHGAKVSVESELGKGSRFTVQFDRSRA
ncbi:MAG: ATP-binding protein [Fimbriimonadaceae bacterium]